MQMRVEDGPLVGAFTDPKGYAAANVPVGDRMGLYHMTVAMQDSHGRESATIRAGVRVGCADVGGGGGVRGGGRGAGRRRGPRGAE